MEGSFKISNIKLGDKSHPLTAKYSVKNNRIDIKIFVSKNYTETPLIKAIKSISWPGDELGKLLMSKKSNNSLYLHALYNFSQRYMNLMTGAEKIAFRGLGRKMLCFALCLASKNDMVSDLNMPVFLEASGGDCDINNIQQIFDKSMSEERAIYILKNHYPDHYDGWISDLEQGFQSSASSYVCVIRENMKLVKYYEKLGFEQTNKIPSDYLAVEMHSTLAKLLQSCEQTPIPELQSFLNKSSSSSNISKSSSNISSSNISKRSSSKSSKKMKKTIL